MRTGLRTTITGILAIVLLGMVFVSKASAQCAFLNKAAAIQSEPWQGTPQFRQASFSLAASGEGSDDRIVGFWKVKFIVENTVIDNGFVQWHSDGTEIMNSSRPPATGNFCLGVWQKSGPAGYQINHFALSYDPGGSLVGPAQIRENVTLNQRADQYEGTFTIDQFDPAGNPIAHVAGRVTATRITVDTSVADVL